MDGYRSFLFFLVSALLLGFSLVIFVLVWVLYYTGDGLAWDGSKSEFNWHPVLIVTGFIFIEGIAIIVYRLPWTWRCSKLLMKYIHAGLHLTAMVMVIVAMVAVFDFHNENKIPNMYSLHSWVGIIVVVLFALQLVSSIVVFLVPVTPVSIRAAVMPIHVYSGLLLFGGVIATSLMGITEKLIFALKNPPYSSLPPHGVFANILGLLIVVFGGLILWIATRPGWKRPPEHSFKDQAPNAAAAEIRPPEYSESDVEFNSDAARKRNINLDESGRSTM